MRVRKGPFPPGRGSESNPICGSESRVDCTMDWNRTLRAHVAAPILALLSLCTLSGCLAPAAVASAGLSAAQTGATTWLEGDLVGTYNEMYPDMVWACDAAAAKLALSIRIRRLDPEVFFLYLEDDKGVDVDIQVNRRTARLCQIKIRVGLWGNKPLSALMMSTIEHELERRHGRVVPEIVPPVIPSGTPRDVR